MNSLIKKIVTFLATTLIFACVISINNVKAVKAISNPCKFNKITDLRVERNFLEWESDYPEGEEIEQYIIEVYSGSSIPSEKMIGEKTTTSTSYSILGSESITNNEGTYSFRIWAGSKSDSCADNYVDLLGVEVVEMELEVKTSSGGSAVFNSPTSGSNKTLAVDLVVIKTTNEKGYYPLFKNSEGKEICPSPGYQTLDSEGLLYELNTYEFKNNKIEIYFSNTPVNLTLDLGINHTTLDNGDKFAEKFVEYVNSLSSGDIICKVGDKPNEIIIALLCSSLTPIGNITYSMFGISRVLREFIKENNSSNLEIHNNEVLTGTCYESNIESYEDLYKYERSTTTIADANYKIYAIWMKYEDIASGNNTWSKGDDNDLSIKFKRNISDSGYIEEDEGVQIVIYPSTFDCFKKIVTVKNGNQEEDLVLDKDYTYGKGSLVINLSKDYLNNLEAGEYTLKAAFNPHLDDPEEKTNLYAFAKFTVKEQQKGDTTPDHTPSYVLPRTGIE